MHTHIGKILSVLILGSFWIVFFPGAPCRYSIAAELGADVAVAAQKPAENEEVSPKNGKLYLEWSGESEFIVTKWRLLRDMLWWDVLEILVGTFFLILGLAAK